MECRSHITVLLRTEQGQELLGDANDGFASGPPAQEARGWPLTSRTVNILPPAVKNGQNFASGSKILLPDI